MPNAWNLEDGLKLVRSLQPETRKYGYHLTLGGGVLNKGESTKDVDLFFLPLCNPAIAVGNAKDLVTWLIKLWGQYESLGKDYAMSTSSSSYTDARIEQTLSFDVETPARTVTPPVLSRPYSPSPPPTYPPPSADAVVPANLWGSIIRSAANSNWFVRSSSAVELFSAPFPEIQEAPEPSVGSPYLYKMKFNRRGDRIDVFVM